LLSVHVSNNEDKTKEMMLDSYQVQVILRSRGATNFAANYNKKYVNVNNNHQSIKTTIISGADGIIGGGLLITLKF
jgi:hypothetical protein